MKNVYTVSLSENIKIEAIPHFGSKDTATLYVIASSFQAAEEAALKKHPNAKIRGINLINYSGVPIVIGD